MFFVLLGIGSFISFIATFTSFIGTVAEHFSTTQPVYCNHVIFYWAFVEIVVILPVIGLGIVVFAVSCIVFVFLVLLALRS